MSTIKVRLKDASGNVLHPETDWSVVQNKPSIKVADSNETWNVAGGSIYLNSTGNISIWADDEDEGRNDIYLEAGAQGTIYVKDQVTKKTEVRLADYPINYEKLTNKPTYFPTSWSKISGKPSSNCSLYFYTNTKTTPATYTLLIDSTNDTGSHYTYYFSNGSWVTAPSGWKSSASLIF